MAKFDFISPLDQPPGTRRLLDEIKNGLSDTRFSEFRLIVAYAKSGPLHRLRDLLEEWRKAGKATEAVIGLDQRGTSREALELSMELFDKVYLTREAGITFHPKIYLFQGATAVRAFIGSNNLTVGGTEKNFEAAVILELDLPDDSATAAFFENAWAQLLPAACPATKLLDESLLVKLIADGDVVKETAKPESDADPGGAGVTGGGGATKSGLKVKPESPLPKKTLASTSAVAPSAGAPTPSHGKVATGRGLVIQVRPHHNGEIFLSVTAALQDPKFFNWPFTGTTTPKKPNNPTYPQLYPDPLVNITVYDASPQPTLVLSGYPLNTVYYAKKSEIRITALPLVSVVPEYSIMIVERAQSVGIDYEITIHTPNSPDYAAWLNACNQTMPGGGKTPRRFGWL